MLVQRQIVSAKGTHIQYSDQPSNPALRNRQRNRLLTCKLDCFEKHDRHIRASSRQRIASEPLKIATIVLLQSVWQSCSAAESPEKYVPGPVEVGPEIWLGTLAACVPFVIGSWEFGKRIIIQRRCTRCQGSGLVMRGQFARKCPECGGFFPWQGWWKFFTSTAAPGNGGPLRAPKGQTSVLYKVPPKSENGRPGSKKADEVRVDDATVGVSPESIKERS